MNKKRSVFFVALFLLFSVWWSTTYFRSHQFLIPIQFLDSYQIPSTAIEIEGNMYQVEIDLGTKIPLSLNKNVLEIVQKIPYGVSKRMDFRGEKYETPLYLLPEVKIGAETLKKVKAKEESYFFSREASIIAQSKEPMTPVSGRIGRDFFCNKNLYMDFKNGIFLVCEKNKKLKKIHCKNAISAPLFFTPDGIVLEAETDKGTKRFVLDTGSTASAMRRQADTPFLTKKAGELVISKTTKFSLGGIDFGPQDLILLDIGPEFKEMDGVLGMDFLKKHPIYLDFDKQTIFIDQN